MKRIPKYVIEIMSRATYNFTAKGENYAAGYTIDIAKYSHYEYADTFKKEIENLVKWANSQCKESAYILNVPKKTEHKCMQYATITIFDPIMQKIEQYIKK